MKVTTTPSLALALGVWQQKQEEPPLNFPQKGKYWGPEIWYRDIAYYNKLWVKLSQRHICPWDICSGDKKFVWSKKNVSPIILVKKTFWFKKKVYQKKIYCLKKSFGQKIFLSENSFWSKNFWIQKKILVERFTGWVEGSIL